jgi:hypothetical protein
MLRGASRVMGAAEQMQVEPNASQTKRDDNETPRMWAFLRKHLDVFRFAEGHLNAKLHDPSALPE